MRKGALEISAVPVMDEFRTDLRTVEWVLTSYNLAFTVFMIDLGSLGDTPGRRRPYVLGQVAIRDNGEKPCYTSSNPPSPSLG